MMIDIDFFKPYNDHYGHWQGDECLREVASALNSVARRPSDMVARYGGEEFVVLLKGIDRDGAWQIAQAMLDAVMACEIVHEFSEVSNFVTVSIGVAFRDAKEEISREDLLKRADEKLYEAKESGRNRFCC
jgi:diguanylate cyclase (GGDEF)-like protein